MKNKIVRKKLLEHKEKQHRLLIEEYIIENRLRSIFESYGNMNEFHLLSESKKKKLSNSFIQELFILNESGLLNEQLLDAMKSILGQAFEGALQSIVEPFVDSFLSWVGLGGYFKNFLVSFFTRNPRKVIDAFRGCNNFTNVAVEALCEALVMMLEEKFEVTSTGAKIIRNSMMEAFNSTNFKTKMVEGLQGPICDLYDDLYEKAKNTLKNLVGMGDETKTETQPQTT